MIRPLDLLHDHDDQRDEMTRATETPTADLIRLARRLGVPLADRSARRLRARLGDQGAHDRVEAIGALLRLAAGIGAELRPMEAVRRLDAAGDYDTAADRFLEGVGDRRQRVLDRSWARYERELWAGDAASRHAPYLGSSAAGALAWQVQTLLRAARDAGLVEANYRSQIATVVDAEVRRRFPIRTDEVTIGEAGVDDARSTALQARARRDETDARRRFLQRAPELHQQIERLADSGHLRRDVEAVLDRLRGRLDAKVSDGWRPDPARYKRDVVDRAFADARTA